MENTRHKGSHEVQGWAKLTYGYRSQNSGYFYVDGYWMGRSMRELSGSSRSVLYLNLIGGEMSICNNSLSCSFNMCVLWGIEILSQLKINR